MITALAGRRIDASPDVEAAIASALRELSATVLVCSAAAGADLLALEAAGRTGIRRRVVLPFSPEEFHATSVADRPGDWGERYERLLAELEADDLVVLPRGRGPGAWLAANSAILDQAEALAGPEGHVTAIAVWEGRSRGEGDTTAAFVEEAAGRGIPVRHVLVG